MQKIIKYTLTVALGVFSIVYFTGCKKKDPAPSKIEMLSNSWKVSSATVNGTLDGITDYSSYRFAFNADGTYSFMVPGSGSGTWEFNSSETKIILDAGSSDASEMVIISIASNEVKLEITNPATFKTGQEVIVYTLVPA